MWQTLSQLSHLPALSRLFTFNFYHAHHHSLLEFLSDLCPFFSCYCDSLLYSLALLKVSKDQKEPGCLLEGVLWENTSFSPFSKCCQDPAGKHTPVCMLNTRRMLFRRDLGLASFPQLLSSIPAELLHV